VVISYDGLLAVIVGSGWNRENPAIGYDHHITASAFLPFSGVFPPETTTFPWVLARNLRNWEPESLY